MVVARAVLTFDTCRAREPIVHARAVALPPLVLAAVYVATRLTDGSKHTVAPYSFPHVLIARYARLAGHGARLVRKGPVGARIARAHACIGCERAGAARRLCRAARRCVEARLGWRALDIDGQVSSSRVRALLARQRSASALWAVVAWRTWDRFSRCVRPAIEASGAKTST